MKIGNARAILVLTCLFAVQLDSPATTCVSNKKFKVKQVCGIVTDPTNVAIPNVDVELLDKKSAIVQHAVTNADGRFNIQDVPKGEYALQVKSPYFVSAWQPFILTKKNSKTVCNKPIPVRLEVAGRCSWVSQPK